MTDAEVQKIKEYISDPENAYKCVDCPVNEQADNGTLPCGQWQCWVVLRTETWGKRGKG